MKGIVYLFQYHFNHTKTCHIQVYSNLRVTKAVNKLNDHHKLCNSPPFLQSRTKLQSSSFKLYASAGTPPKQSRNQGSVRRTGAGCCRARVSASALERALLDTRLQLLTAWQLPHATYTASRGANNHCRQPPQHTYLTPCLGGIDVSLKGKGVSLSGF